jgi:hypothetical protein
VAVAWSFGPEKFFLGRLTERYLRPVEILRDVGQWSGEGFAILTILCGIVEFLESTVQGVNYCHAGEGPPGVHEYSSSSKLFTSFLTERPPFAEKFDDELAAQFYAQIRCGLLHEARTKGGWRIHAKSPNRSLVDRTERIVFRDDFLSALQDFVSSYSATLRTDPGQQDAFIRKFDSDGLLAAWPAVPATCCADGRSRMPRWAAVSEKWSISVVTFLTAAFGDVSEPYQRAKQLQPQSYLYGQAVQLLNVLKGAESAFNKGFLELKGPGAQVTAKLDIPLVSDDAPKNTYNTTIYGGHGNAVHHSGDLNMGTKYTSNITGSTIGAVAVGSTSQATGTVTLGTSTLTQEQHRAALREAQSVLVHDQDVLDQIDGRLYEALGQFLRLARDIQVEQLGIAEVQARMKETLDDVWAQQTAKGLRAQTIPKTLELAEALAKNPAMTEVIKHLLGA